MGAWKEIFSFLHLRSFFHPSVASRLPPMSGAAAACGSSSSSLPACWRYVRLYALILFQNTVDKVKQWDRRAGWHFFQWWTEHLKDPGVEFTGITRVGLWSLKIKCWFFYNDSDGWMDGSQLCLGRLDSSLFIFNELRFQSMLPNFTHSLFIFFFKRKETLLLLNF